MASPIHSNDLPPRSSSLPPGINASGAAPAKGVVHGIVHQIRPPASSPIYDDEPSSAIIPEPQAGSPGGHSSPISAGTSVSGALPTVISSSELHRTPSIGSHSMASVVMLSDRLKSQQIEQTREKESEIDKKINSAAAFDVVTAKQQEAVRVGVGMGVEEGAGHSFRSLAEVYDARDLSWQKDRYRSLRDKFLEVYGTEPEFFSRSPGRVNLIGDNIDGNGYSVLPLALDRDIVIAVRTTSNPKFELHNTSPSFTPRSFAILPASDSYVDFDPKKKDWATRAKSAFRATCEMLAIHESKGLQCLLDGDIPVSAGLASSAAYVSAICLAVCRANGRSAKRGNLVQAALTAEELLGIKSGGADQCASLLPPSRGTSLLVSFGGTSGPSGVKSEVVVLPPGAAFVVADTCVEVDKVAMAPSRHNVRVLETRLAAATIENDINLILASANKPTLRMVQDAWLEREEIEFGEGVGREAAEINELKSLMEERWEMLEGGKGWRETGYSEADVGDELGLSVEDLRARYFTDLELVLPERLHLYRRALHVFAEAARVYEFRDLCRKVAIEAELGLPHPDALKELGDIINASQSSVKELYDSSCPEVDELVSICRDHGALGCKMTGAGWGGCVISLVRNEDVTTFVQGVRKAYHERKFPDKAKEGTWLSDVVFATGAGVGGGIIEATDLEN